MKSITKTDGGFQKVVFESVIDTLAGGTTLDLTGYTNADGIVPAGTWVGAKDPSTGISPLVYVVGSGSATGFSAKPIGMVHADVKIEDNTLVGVVLEGVARKAALPNSSLKAANAIATLGSVTGGSGYANATYNGVALTGGTGKGATANIVVSGGAVSTVTLVSKGAGYTAADVLSAPASAIGGTGSGFSVPVSTVTTLTTATDAELAAAVPKISIV